MNITNKKIGISFNIHRFKTIFLLSSPTALVQSYKYAAIDERPGLFVFIFSLEFAQFSNEQ